MYARMVTFRLAAEHIPQADEMIRTQLLPALRTQGGFAGLSFLTDAEGDECVVLTCWNSESDVSSNEASGWFQDQLKALHPVLGAPVSRHRYALYTTS